MKRKKVCNTALNAYRSPNVPLAIDASDPSTPADREAQKLHEDSVAHTFSTKDTKEEGVDDHVLVSINDLLGVLW